MSTIHRTLDFQTRADDAKAGRVTYVASTPSIDSHGECIVPSGARPLLKNTPFCDAHRYDSIARVLGKVVAAHVEGKKLINVVDWAIGCGNELAELGYRMVKAGMLPACSIGFFPIITLRPGEIGYDKTKRDLGFTPQDQVRAIYTEFQQVELSACAIGSNADALVAARSRGVLTGREADWLAKGARGDAPRTVSVRIPFPNVTPQALRKAARHREFLATLSAINSDREEERPNILSL